MEPHGPQRRVDLPANVADCHVSDMSPWSSSIRPQVIENGSPLERLLLVRAKRATRRCGPTIRAWRRANSPDHAAERALEDARYCRGLRAPQAASPAARDRGREGSGGSILWRRHAPEPTGAMCAPPLSWDHTVQGRNHPPTSQREYAKPGSWPVMFDDARVSGYSARLIPPPLAARQQHDHRRRLLRPL